MVNPLMIKIKNRVTQQPQCVAYILSCRSSMGSIPVLSSRGSQKEALCSSASALLASSPSLSSWGSPACSRIKGRCSGTWPCNAKAYMPMLTWAPAAKSIRVISRVWWHSLSKLRDKRGGKIKSHTVQLIVFKMKSRTWVHIYVILPRVAPQSHVQRAAVSKLSTALGVWTVALL